MTYQSMEFVRRRKGRVTCPMNELERARRYKKTRNRFLKAERRALEHRRDGQLARLLGGVSPTSESAAWELAWLEQEDRGSAEEGPVELRRADGEIEYKHIDDLSLRD
jgi:transposase